MDFTIINFTEPTISGIASVVKWLIGISSSIAAGIILFTLVLKLITFPFDFFSRYSMRKNSVKMEEMRPELEKLQKQYANDKTLYNQKMMALYKKNGYSMWGSCLPTIITLVIFIVAINGYSSYSQFQNKEYFYNMSLAYNSAVYDGIEEDSENKYIIKDAKTGAVSVTDALLKALSPVKCIAKDGKTELTITVDKKSDTSYLISTGSKVTLKVSDTGNGFVYGYQLPDETTFNEYVALARQRSAEKYREEQVPFFWVKNIWMTDSPLEHPVYSDWEVENAGCSACFGGASGFVNKQGYKNDGSANMNEELYNELTFNLETEKNEANGYFILCILTAGISFLMQLVMSKSQKAQMELQTVDGQGARQQKMMMWMMPVLMAFFSFMYTAAFSIYLILSSVISILTTLLINWVVDKKFGKPNDGKKEIIRGRVYNAPKEEKKEKKVVQKEKPQGNFIPEQPKDKTKKKDKKSKKDNTPKIEKSTGDFIKGEEGNDIKTINNKINNL